MAFVGALAVALLLSNQTAPLPQGGTAIASASEYQDAMSKMTDLSKSRLEAYDQGKALTADDKAKLREAGGIVDRMNAYLPLMATLRFVSGKIHHILGEDEVAEQMFRQCTFDYPAQANAQPADAAAIRATGAEAAYQLSLLLVNRRDFKGALEQADAAVKAVPQSSLYHTARASALNELRRTDEAKIELFMALRLDPSNKRAASLLKFLSH